MKPIHPTSWLSIALLTLFLFATDSRAEVADLSKAPVTITLSNGIVFKLFGLAKDGKSIFPEGGFSEESVRSLFTNSAIADKHFPRPDHHVPFHLIFRTIPALDRNNTNSLFYRWVDENGYESLSQGHVVEWSGSFQGKEEAKTTALFTYPSRSRVMKLRIYSNSGPQGAVSLRNPFSSDVAPWPETTLPQEQHTNDVTVKLLEANCRMEPASNLRPADQGLIKPWTELKLQILSHDQVDTNWSLRSITASDATGNSIPELPLTGPVDLVRYYDLLWPVEPIRYRVGLLREYQFPSNECVLIKGVAVPNGIKLGSSLFSVE